MTFANKLRDIMKVELKEESTPSEIKDYRNELLSKVAEDYVSRKNKDKNVIEHQLTKRAKENAKLIRGLFKQYSDGKITADEIEEKFVAIDDKLNKILAAKASKEKDGGKQSYFAIEAFTDFEGNSIPQRYRPVYIARYNEGDYDFTPRLIDGLSLFDTAAEKDVFSEIKGYLGDKVNIQPKYNPEEATPQAVQDVEDEPDEPKKPAEKLPKDIMMPASRIMHSATYVDPREIEAFAKAGIHPELVYASNPKPGWWYEDNDGKKHLIRLYGITGDGYEGLQSVAVREVLPFKNSSAGYLKQVEGQPFLMPVETFRDITQNNLNTETYKYLMKDVPEEERDTPEIWLADIARQKEIMQAKFNAWKEKNDYKYGLSQYTKDSLLNVYYAVEGRHFPIEKALQRFGKKITDVQNTKFKDAFTVWYNANEEKYNLDRFDMDTLHDIFKDVKARNMSVEDAIIQNTEMDFDELDGIDVEESVLNEKHVGEIDQNSKEWIVRDPNLLRRLLPTVGINPIYISNPFTVAYQPWNKSGKADDLDELDERYYIVGIRKPSLSTPSTQIKPEDIKTVYIRNWDKKGAHPQAIDFRELRRMLSAAENDNPIPTLWDRYRTYKDQRKALNRGAYYKWYKLDDSDVIDILKKMQTEDEDYKGVDLVALFNKAKETHLENKYVTRALRDYDREVSFKANKSTDFDFYQYAKDIETLKPTRAKNQGTGSNPYKFLMKM